MALLTQTRELRRRWGLHDLWRFTVPKDELPTVTVTALPPSVGITAQDVSYTIHGALHSEMKKKKKTSLFSSQNISTTPTRNNLGRLGSLRHHEQRDEQGNSHQNSGNNTQATKSTPRLSTPGSTTPGASANQHSGNAPTSSAQNGTLAQLTPKNVPANREISSAGLSSSLLTSEVSPDSSQSIVHKGDVTVSRSSAEIQCFDKGICVGKLKYFSPPEEMQKIWDEIVLPEAVDRLLQVTRTLSLPRNDALIEPEFCMVGEWDGKSEVVHLKPTVWIRCGSVACKKAIQGAVYDMQDLHIFSNGRVQVQLRAPLFASYNTIGSPQPQVQEIWSTKSKVYISNFHFPSACGIKLRLEDENTGSTWILGGFIKIDAKTYGLTTAHPFVSRVGFIDVDRERYELPTARPILSRDVNELPVVPRSLDEIADCSSGDIALGTTSADGNNAVGNFLGGEATQPWSEAAIGPYNYGGHTNQIFGNRQSHSSMNDYALIEIPHSLKDLNNLYCYQDDIQHDEFKTGIVRRIASGMSCGNVHIIVGHFDTLSGYLLKEAALFIDGARIFRTRKIETDAPLSMGVSGAWVVRGPELLGMIIAVYRDEPYAHMLPIADIVSDLQLMLTIGNHIPKIKIKGSSEGHRWPIREVSIPYPVNDTGGLKMSLADERKVTTDVAKEKQKWTDVIRTDEPRTNTPHWKRMVLLSSISILRFVIGFDITMFPTIMPSITDHFLSLDHIGWYGSAYLLGRCFTYPLLVRYYCGLNMLWIHTASVGTFMGGFLCCALAHNSAVIIAGRVITGCGAAGCWFSSPAVLESARPGRAATAVVPHIHELGILLGPVVGGAISGSLTQPREALPSSSTWRWCFYTNLGISGLAALLLVLAFIDWPLGGRRPRISSEFAIIKNAKHRPTSNTATVCHIDLVGLIFLLAAALCLMFGLQMGVSRSWRDATMGLLVSAGAFAAIFIFTTIWPKSVSRLPFRENGVLGISALFWGCSFYTFNHFFSTWLQSVKGSSPKQSGVMYLSTVGGVFVMPVVALSHTVRAMSKFGKSTKLFTFAASLSLSLMALGTGLLSTLHSRSITRHWVGYQIIFGIGAGLGVDQAVDENAAVQLSEAFGGAVAIYAAQTVFMAQLRSTLQSTATTTSIASFDIWNSGLTEFRYRFSGDGLEVVTAAFNHAVTRSFFVSTACVSLVVFGIIWNIRWTFIKRKLRTTEPVREAFVATPANLGL